jgi:uncharacterized protein with LGFP repeats
MCDHCDDAFDRRGFLRRAVAGGVTVAAGATLFPTVAHASGGSSNLTGKATTTGTTAAGGRTTATTAAAGTLRTRPVAVAAPPIVTRAEWGADERMRDSKRVFAPVRKIVIHHSAGPNRPADPAATVRDIYTLQVQDKHYQDLGYNFLIDHHGVVYEGRWARNYPAGALHDGEDGHGRGVMGAHATYVNAGACGICLIGNFSYSQPTTAAMASLVQLVAWKSGRFMIDPLGSDAFSPPFATRRTFQNIVGHRGVGSTLCPGRALNALIPWVRTQVAQKIGRFPTANNVDLLHALSYTNGATYPKRLP